MTSSDCSQAGKSGTTSARVLYNNKKTKTYNKDTDVNQFRDMHSYILVVLGLHHTKPTGFKVVREALYTRTDRVEKCLLVTESKLH